MNIENYVKSVLSGLKTWIQFTFAKKSDISELYYTEKTWKCLLKNATAYFMRAMDGEAYGINMFSAEAISGISTGNAVKVEWNGVEYEGIVGTLEGMMCTGNLSIVNAVTGGAEEDTGEPFMVVFSEYGTMFYTMETDTSNRTVSIHVLVDVVHQIDNKYIPLATSEKPGAVHPYTSTETGGDVWMDPITGRLYAADSYELPAANSTTLGGVMPVDKSVAMTQDVGVDGSGRLYVAPYSLPIATSSRLGGVLPTTKTNDMTQPVGIDGSGMLYTMPSKQADWDQTDSSYPSYIKNKPRVGLNYVVLSDESNGLKYVVKIVDGTLVTHQINDIISLEIEDFPSKTSYVEGEAVDLSGAVLRVVYEDGTSKYVTDYYATEDYISESSTDITIVYKEYGKYISVSIPISVTPFNPSIVLKDFTYTAKADDTYSITGWKGTSGGASGTEMIIPDNSLIVL